MITAQRTTPCLWFSDEAEEAAQFYTGIFKISRIMAITRHSDAGFEVHQRPAGSVMTVAFELDGQSFRALNGGRCSRSTKPYPWRSTARLRRRSTTTGSGFR